MRIESMVAQQAILSAGAPRTRRPLGSHPVGTLDAGPSARAASSRLPQAVAERLASLLDGDPAFAEAVSAHLPAARRATARDFAAYGYHDEDTRAGARLDISG